MRSLGLNRRAPKRRLRRLGALVLGVALLGSAIAARVPGAAGATPADGAGIEPPAGFSIHTILDNLTQDAGGNPTAFEYAPDGRIFIARKTGILDVYDGGVLHRWVDLRSEVNTYQSRGLIGLALDPNYLTNHRVFLLFTQELDPANPDSPEPAGGQLISLTSQAGNLDVADPASRVTLVTGFDSQATLHSVAGLRFGPDGTLYVGLGDGNGNGVGTGTSIKAVDLDQLNGKILRIDPDTGNGVASNPYYDAAHPGSVRSRVFARGFRNPFRFTIDPVTQTLYVGDVGWNTWEMFQVFPQATANPDKDRDAGWPCYEGGDGVSLVQPDYATAPQTAAQCKAIYTPAQGGTGPGALPPLYAYLHSDPGGDYGSAIVGGPRYLGTSNYPAAYVGKVFVGDYARSRIQTVDLATGDATDFGTAGSWSNPVDMQIGPDGNVWFLAFGNGELDEIVANGSNNPPVAVASADVTTTTASSLTVHFTGDQSHDPDSDAISYSWNFGDGSALATGADPAHTYGEGAFRATLTVTDSHGATDTESIDIVVGVSPPVVTFVQPAATTKWKIGDTVSIAVNAIDPQDGPLSGDSVSTRIDYWTGGHVYPVTDFSGLVGSFVAADQGFQNAYYEITTSATNSFGLTGTTVVDVAPKTVKVTVTSTPSGAAVAVDGVAETTPFSFKTIVGSEREVSAPSSITSKGVVYDFAQWQVDGGAAKKTNFVSYTVAGSNMKVDATFLNPNTPPPPPPPPPPAPKGYWIADSGGGVHAFGLADYGDLSTTKLDAAIVGIAGTPDRQGYWLSAPTVRSSASATRTATARWRART